MSEEAPTKFGFTLSNVLSLFSLLGAIFLVWLSLSMRVTEAEVRILYLETARKESIAREEGYRKENKSDHDRIMTKLDRLIELKILP